MTQEELIAALQAKGIKLEIHDRCCYKGIEFRIEVDGKSYYGPSNAGLDIDMFNDDAAFCE